MDEKFVIQGDARQLSELGFEPESVDCFLTSPPYFNLKRYDAEAESELGQSQNLDEYLADLEAILGNCFALAKPTGVLWLVIDTLRTPAEKGGLGELVPLPFRIADAARQVGWRLQEVVIWEKNKTLPYSGQGKLRNLIEYVLLFTKSQEFKHRPFRVADQHGTEAEWLSGWPERYHPLGRRPANIWKIPIPTQGMWAHSERLHFCPFPQQLVARCIELTTDKDDLVVDPFAGIGTVPAQAEAMGRRGRGVELNAGFIEIFEQRILPAFQAAWESEAEMRDMGRADQLREAETLMLLRALKGGKELSKVLERWVHDKPQGAPAAAVESIVVEAPQSFSEFLDVEQGIVGRPPVTLAALISAGGMAKVSTLAAEIGGALSKPPFSTLGLDFSLEVIPRADFIRDTAHRDIYEFEQARRASFTSPITLSARQQLPRLLSTTALNRVVHGDKLSPLELARKEAERRVLNSELALASDTTDLAAKLGLPQAEVQRLLLEHGIDHTQQTFGIPINIPLGNS
jgi:DNA modification methylase